MGLLTRKDEGQWLRGGLVVGLGVALSWVLFVLFSVLFGWLFVGLVLVVWLFVPRFWFCLLVWLCSGLCVPFFVLVLCVEPPHREYVSVCLSYPSSESCCFCWWGCLLFCCLRVVSFLLFLCLSRLFRVGFC
ncbi:unnamed protein product [Polarella glacialis]|uniref:Transmembrane protein n=1 Tax=Polarella glacialis TaxID=89957 RepID=A0A813FJQ2_POLGL|nr:unnamed protein product [Polarella glacialis]